MAKIAVLYEAGQAVLSTFDPDEVLQRILAIARDYFHLQNVAILLYDKEAEQLCVRSQIGWDEGKDKVCMGHNEGLTGAALVKKQPVYAPDVSQDPRYICAAQSTRSELAIPLMVREDVVGVLDCQSDRLDHFDHETIELLTLFSTQASIALQNARLYSLERQRARQLEAINTIAQQSTAVMDLEELLARACVVIQQAFQVHHVALFLREEGELVLRAHKGTLTACIPMGGRFPAGEEPWARVLGASGAVVCGVEHGAQLAPPLGAQHVPGHRVRVVPGEAQARQPPRHGDRVVPVEGGAAHRASSCLAASMRRRSSIATSTLRPRAVTA